MAPWAHPVRQRVLWEVKGLKGCGNQSMELFFFLLNVTCENLPEAGPGVRALIMRSKSWEALKEDHSHLRRLTAVLQEATPRKKVSFGPVTTTVQNLWGVTALS